LLTDIYALIGLSYDCFGHPFKSATSCPYCLFSCLALFRTNNNAQSLTSHRLQRKSSVKKHITC